MKLMKLKTSLLLLLGSLLTINTGSAALTYTAGDIFLGFRGTAAGDTQAYLVNIGPGSLYRDATSSFAVPVGNITADLVIAFGSAWATRADLEWGVIGANSTAASGAAVDGDPVRTLYASRFGDGTALPTTPQPGPKLGVAATVGPVATRVFNMEGLWLNSGTPGVANNAAFNTAADAFSFASYAGASSPFSYSALTGLDGTFGTGTAGTSLDLFRMIPGSNTLRGSYEGTFTITDSGALTFNVAVPEPSSVICLALVGLGLGRRRRPANV